MEAIKHFDFENLQYCTLDYNKSMFDSDPSTIMRDTAGAASPVVPPAVPQFANRAHAQQVFAQRQVAHDWHSPQNDVSVPKS
jgi:hypothetical protein